jgi:exodeoxyribonuclease-5
MHTPDDTLSPDQEQALADLHAFVESDRTRHALAGPAGSGKTYLIGRFLAEIKIPVKLAATTNKAAAVAGAMSPDGEAATIHSLLGLQPEPDQRRGRMILKRKREPKLDAGELVIVDEASMCDSELITVIDEYAREIGFRVLYVGDAYQLPPIYEGRCPAFDRVPTSHLTTIHRQALENPLIAAATGFRQVLDGAAFPRVTTQAPGVLCTDARSFADQMLGTFDSPDYRGDGDHCRALAWTNARVVALNRAIRRRLIGPEADHHPFTEGETFIVNEAVSERERLVLPTEAKVRIERAEPETLEDAGSGITVPGHRVTAAYQGRGVELFCADDRQRAGALLSHYASRARALQRACTRGRATPELDTERRVAWRRFFGVKQQLAELRPPHASTVHKSQGSTYRHAFIDLEDIGRCTRWDLIARLVYVALTRPSETAVITGALPARLYHREAA